MELTKQKENVTDLLQLIKDNPGLPIVPMVASECVCDDSHGYWMGLWGSAFVTKYYCLDEKMYDYDDFDELVEMWIDQNYEEYDSLSDEELEKLARDKVGSYEWVDAIIVFIDNL
jgi:hypothetical protein